jgi:hypothetical protein
MVHDYHLRRASVATMNIYEIGILMSLWTLSCVWFYTMGVNTGYIEGRKAVRKFYEQRDKVRA